MTDVMIVVRSALPPDGIALENVVVRLYTEEGAFLQAGTTNEDGEAFLGNRAEGTYEVRVTFEADGVMEGENTRFLIDIDGEADESVFDLTATISSLPEATSADFCRCSGVFTDLSGAPSKKTTIEFGPVDNSLRVRSSPSGASVGLVHSPIRVVTDSSGYASVNLLRNAAYRVQVPGTVFVGWNTVIPDLSRCYLPDVVFPAPSRVEVRDGDDVLDSVVVTQGTTSRYPLTTVFRSGLRLDGLVSVAFTVSVSGFCSFSVEDHELVIAAKFPGTVTLTAEQYNYGPGYGFPCLGSNTLNTFVITIVDDPDIPDDGAPVIEEGAENPEVILDGGII